MSTNVIKQYTYGEGSTQTIKMVVRSNERGPQGEQGPRGNAGPRGEVGPRGADGAIQYQAGTGIAISANNIITATGDATATWGGLQGDIQTQTDLQEEFGEYTKTENLGAVALSNDYNDLINQPTIPTVNNATLTISQNGSTLATFTANSSTNKSANITSPVITMTDTDPGEGVTMFANNYIGVYGGDPIILDYSTSEVNTGAKWIDGSPIYKKTVDTGALPNNTTNTVPHGITNLSKVIKIEGYSFRSSDSYWFPLPTVYPNEVTNQVSVFGDATNIYIKTGADKSAITESYVTLYYTKSA